MHLASRESLSGAAKIIAQQKESTKYKTAHLDTYSHDGLNQPKNTYEETFAPFISTSFLEIIQGMKTEGKSTHVLDLFGGGYFLENLDPIDSLTAIRLCNIDAELIRRGTFIFLACRSSDEEELVSKRQAHLRNFRDSKKRSVLTGNLYLNSTWAELRKHMEEKCIGSFDLIVCRPQVAFRNKFFLDRVIPLEAYDIIFAKLFKRATTQLSKSGILFTQVPEYVELQQLQQLKEEYEATGFDILIEYSNAEGQSGYILKVTRIKHVSIRP